MIPDAQSKEVLTGLIREFLKTAAPGIRHVTVLDWGSLSSWLNTLRRVADNWLEIGFPGIAGHQEHIDSLQGFRKYLLSENLAYEPPEPNADLHPEVIWKQLSAEDEDSKPGLVIYGPGGVGKSRLCMEVAERAHADGWRVLHVSPVEQSLTEKDLMSVIAAGARPTLVCFDYIDFMYGLDHISLGGRQVRDAVYRGVRLRYLANSRPMWTESALRDPAALEVYSFRELRAAGGQQERLLPRMIQTVSPQALAKWGMTELLRVCGRRPVIVLLIAREIERRLAEGSLASDELEAARGGDISVWLRKRLAGDQLKIPESASYWQRSAPPDPMIAACAALVAAPNTRETLVAAADAALRSIESNADAEFVVRQLTKMGWLEPVGYWFATPHDVVADEVFDQIVRDGDDIRESVLTAVLSAGMCEPGAIGRLAAALRRWIGAESPNPAAVERAERFATKWLQDRAEAIGALLASGNPDATGFALGSILKGRPWSEAAVQCWDKLFGPWLAANQRRLEARHVLYSGLREESVAQRMVQPAMAWLEVHCREEVASYVLAPLLGRTDLAKEQAETVVGRALAWLAEFPLKIEAGFVLPPLLGRTGLAKEQAETAVGRGLDWLAVFPLQIEAQFVLNPLLGRTDLAKEQAETAVGHGLVWLAEFPLKIEARFVLNPLLGRTDLAKEQAETAVRRGLAWLAKFPLEIEAGFVLAPLVGRTDLAKEQAETLVGRALAWLAKFPLEIEAGFVLAPLLGRTDLAKEQAETVVGRALVWLAEFPLKIEAGFVLPPLLWRTELTETANTSTVNFALDWLPGFLDQQDAEFVLKRLLRRHGLPVGRIGDLKRQAITQLRDRVRNLNDEGFLLRPWLRCRVRHPELDQEIIGLAIEWLRADPERPGADFVFNRILRREDAPDTEWLFAAHTAADWLRVCDRSREEQDFTVNSVLNRTFLLPRELLDPIVGRGLRLLQSERNEKSKVHLAGKLRRAVAHLPSDDPLAVSVQRAAADATDAVR